VVLPEQGDAARALEVFERVVALEPDDSIPDKQKQPLLEAARNGLVAAYASAGVPDKAAEYFQPLGGDTPALLQRLARPTPRRASGTARPRSCAS
jgi:hypothetical protein